MDGQLVVQRPVVGQQRLDAEHLAAQRFQADPDSRLQFAVAFGEVVQELALDKTFNGRERGNDVTHVFFFRKNAGTGCASNASRHAMMDAISFTGCALARMA